MGITGQIMSTVMGTYSQNRSLEQQGLAQQATARNMVQSMNYSFANLEQERQSTFEATIEDLTKTRLQALRQQSAVNAAVNEGMIGGGRTADLVKRSVANDTARTAESIKTNYLQKSNEIDLNKESTLLNTKNQIQSMPKLEKPNILSTMVGWAGDYYSIKNTEEERKHRQKMAGIDDKGNASTKRGTRKNANKHF